MRRVEKQNELEHSTNNKGIFSLPGNSTPTYLHSSFESCSLQSGTYLTSVGAGERLLRSLPVPTIMEVNRI